MRFRFTKMMLLIGVVQVPAQALAGWALDNVDHAVGRGLAALVLLPIIGLLADLVSRLRARHESRR